MSGIYCPLTNGTISYETCANCVDMLCEEEKVSNKQTKLHKKKKKNRFNDEKDEDDEN